MYIYIYIYIDIYIYIYYIYIHWFQKILTAKKYIYIRHFEICYVILRSQIDHMLYMYAKVVMRRPNPKAYGHLGACVFV